MAATDDPTSQAEGILGVIRSLGLEPYVSPQPLPKITADDVHLVLPLFGLSLEVESAAAVSGPWAAELSISASDGYRLRDYTGGTWLDPRAGSADPEPRLACGKPAPARGHPDDHPNTTANRRAAGGRLGADRRGVRERRGRGPRTAPG